MFNHMKKAVISTVALLAMAMVIFAEEEPVVSIQHQAYQEALLPQLLSNSKTAAEVGLNKEQIDKLNAEINTIKEQLTQKRKEMDKSALKQAQLMSAKKINEQALMKAIDNTGRIRTQIAKLQVKQILIIKQSLTQEQIDKAKQILSTRLQKQKERSARQKAKPAKQEKESPGKTSHKDHNDIVPYGFPPQEIYEDLNGGTEVFI